MAAKILNQFGSSLTRLGRGTLALVLLLFLSLPNAIKGLTSHSGDFSANFSSMLAVVVKRLRHNLGLSISASLGVVAVMGIVVCVPIFSHAVSSKVLSEQLNAKALSTRRSLFSTHMYYIDKRSVSPISVEKAEEITRFIQDSIPRQMGLGVKRVMMEVQSGAVGWMAVKTQVSNIDRADESWMSMGIGASEMVPENSVLIEGSWPVYSPSGPVQVAVYEYAADEFFLNVGDQYSFGNFMIEIVGVWRARDETNSIWFELPRTAWGNKFWVPLETYKQRLGAFVQRPVFYLSWYVIMDESSMNLSRAPEYARGLVQLDSDLRRYLPDITTDYSPLEALNSYRERAETLTTLFYAVGGPMIVLALLFISLTANIAVQQYEQETATMRGRGTSWGQVALLNLIETVVLVLIALPLALLVGFLMALLMSQTLSFLRFTSRDDIQLTFQGLNVLWLLLSAVLILLARFLPMMGLSRTTIVRVKQEQSRATRRPLTERFFLDFFLLVPGIYAYVTMSGMAKPVKFLSALQPTEGDAFRDPLLFVAPSLFAMGLCMILLRILPFVLRILAAAVDRMPKVWAYLSLQQVSRRPQDHASALLLIMISLSLAIYSASSAKTLDQWLHDSAYYASGSDMVVREYLIMSSGEGPGPGGGGGGSGTKVDLSVGGYFDYMEHAKLPFVENVTRVGNYDGTFSFGVGEKPARFMGIDRLEFPQVAFYREDFADQPLGALMNLLGADSLGVLMDREVAEEIGLRVGDQIDVSINVVDQKVDLQMVIVGLFNYFPTVYPGTKPTLVVNLDAMFDNPEGVVGYDVWLDLRPDTDQQLLITQIRNMINPEAAVVDIKGDALKEVQVMMDQPERVGLFGILNVGFLATGLMPGIGFVLYSYASLRRRFIQLGILQAIGLSLRQLVGYLALEQTLLMGIAIVCGAVIGLISSYMFVPFLQIGATRGTPVPPFEVLIGWAESAWLSLTFGLILFATMLGTIYTLVRMKVFQAVKMGEAM
jgi:putative ABC transport system permease protein